MTLSANRIHRGSETEFTWERQALDYVFQGLPDVDPFQAWELQEFEDPTTGRLYEIDLLVLGKHALYLVEIKSHPGVVRGDVRDWHVVPRGGGPGFYLENPRYLAQSKARVLASLLQRKMPRGQRPWVEPLVFMSEAVIRLDEAARSHLVDKSGIARALTHGEYPGSGAQHGSIVNRSAMRAVARALHELGLRPSQATRRVGQYRLDRLVNEGPGFQEHLGRHAALEGRTCRVRSYLVPRATSAERKGQLQRAARREAETLTRIGDHPSILKCLDYVEAAPLGPALLFEPFDEGLPLDVVLRVQPNLSFDERVEIIERVAEALHYCHRKNILHRNLSPATVLVRKKLGQPVEVRLHSFQLAWHEETSLGTVHLTGLSERQGLLYQAPEVLEDPSKAKVESDIFSLGALTYFVLTGQHPAATLGDRDRLLAEQRELRIGGVRDDLSPDIDAAVGLATRLHVADRADNAMEWFQVLADAATLPPVEQEESTPDPLSAEQGTMLEGDLRVERVLGSGATARVLHVCAAGGKEYALKVPHDDSCAERLRAEAEALAQLRHHHIVQSYGMRQVGERESLLLELASPETLADLLRKEGTVGLDYARRFGDDLLSALQYLEEHGVQHRDIKPGNIGFTADPKQKKHLVLLDFSLAALEPEQVTAGTPGYRDPFVRQRGRWDSAADRWSAAVTLYEMLIGTRPSHEPGEGSEGAFRVRLESERFDAALRDRLIAFFQRALAASHAERFSSAEQMKTAWVGLFASLEAPRPHEAVPAANPIETASLATPVEALGLSTRARNALDRAGVVTVADLLQVPRNHLSAIRGVGRKVAQEIQQTADALRQRLTAAAEDLPFAPEFRGPRLQLTAGPPLGLEPEAVFRLHDAGIQSTADLAGAARPRVEHILGAEHAAELKLSLLAATPDPTWSVSRWLQCLLAPAKQKLSKGERQVRCLLGLDPLPRSSEPAVLLDVASVAAAFKVSRQAIFANLQLARERWAQSPGMSALVEAGCATLEGLGQVSPLDPAAEALLRNHGDPEASLLHARVLLRLLAECRCAPSDEAGSDRPLHLARIHGQGWLASDPGLLATVRELGRTADVLCRVDPLPSSEKVRESLGRVVEDGPLASLPAEQLVSLAAAASQGAAPSARLELYPVDMAAERALALSAAALSLPQLTPLQVVQRVHARYPRAAPLPPRPALDELLEGYGLVFNDQDGSYLRRGFELPSVTSTVFFSSRLSTAAPDAVPLATPSAMEARAFHEALLSGVERGRFRVVQVPADQADLAGRLLAELLGVRPTSLDHLLWEFLDVERRAMEVEPDNVVLADREGPLGATWPYLVQLVHAAAGKMVRGILGGRERPQILVRPGALARYGLSAELSELCERAEQEEGAAILLLVPSHRDGSAPAINGRLPVPALPAQQLWVPDSWLRNEHRAGPEVV